MTNTQWQFYNNPKDAWEIMLSDCADARVSIDLNQYIFDPAGIGQRFLDLFFEKAKQGVRIRMLCDAVGSRNFINSDYPRMLSEAGIQVMFFNPVSPWRIDNFTTWFFRDHKKILIVDSQIGHTGGLGINDRMLDWRDNHVRLTGPIVSVMEATFARSWEMTLRNKFLGFENYPNNAVGFNFLTSTPILRPRKKQRFIRDAFIDAIRGAKHYIYLTTPYFVPDWKFFRSLRLAARRGVDVRLLLPVYPDVRALNAAANSYFGLAFRSGIKIYRYRKAILHAKSAVIDDEWGTVGSTNLDNLSFKFNYEANIVSTNASFVKDLKQQFLIDLQHASQVNPSEWANRSYTQKIKELITWPVHNIM